MHKFSALLVFFMMISACSSASNRQYDPNPNAFFAPQPSAPYRDNGKSQSDFFNRKCDKDGKGYKCWYE